MFEHNPPLYKFQHTVSQIVRSAAGSCAALSIHNGETLFSFSIPLQSQLAPQVTTRQFGQIDRASRIGLGTSHGVVSTRRKEEVIFNTFDDRPGMERLLTFAGVPCRMGALDNSNDAVETLCSSPYPSTADPWLLDERSGRILSFLAMEHNQYVVFYLID